MKTASPQAQLNAFLSKYSVEMQALTKKVLAGMRRRVPGAVELVYDNYNALVIAFAATEHASDAILSIAAYPRWVNLFFAHGATLLDPKKILQGGGKAFRHVVLREAADLDDREIGALIKRALEAAPKPIDPGSRRRTVIKSISAKQRPRRPR
jgi:hypothetical protein